jgi:hypothetical protein
MEDSVKVFVMLRTTLYHSTSRDHYLAVASQLPRALSLNIVSVAQFDAGQGPHVPADSLASFLYESAEVSFKKNPLLSPAESVKRAAFRPSLFQSCFFAQSCPTDFVEAFANGG